MTGVGKEDLSTNLTNDTNTQVCAAPFVGFVWFVVLISCRDAGDQPRIASDATAWARASQSSTSRRAISRTPAG